MNAYGGSSCSQSRLCTTFFCCLRSACNFASAVMHYTCMFRWQLVATPINAYRLWARSSTFSVVAIGMTHHKHVDLRAANNSCRAARTTVALCIHVYTDPADRKHRHARLRNWTSYQGILWATPSIAGDPAGCFLHENKLVTFNETASSQPSVVQEEQYIILAIKHVITGSF